MFRRSVFFFSLRCPGGGSALEEGSEAPEGSKLKCRPRRLFSDTSLSPGLLCPSQLIAGPSLCAPCSVVELLCSESRPMWTPGMSQEVSCGCAAAIRDLSYFGDTSWISANWDTTRAVPGLSQSMCRGPVLAPVMATPDPVLQCDVEWVGLKCLLRLDWDSQRGGCWKSSSL